MYKGLLVYMYKANPHPHSYSCGSNSTNRVTKRLRDIT